MSKLINRIISPKNNTLSMKLIAITSAAASLLSATAQADLITPTSIFSDSQSSGRVTSNLINGVEMNVVGDPNDYTNWSMSPSDDSLSIGEGWMAGVAAASDRWIIADLGAEGVNLNTISIWNFNPSTSTYLNRSVTQVDIYVSDSIGNNVEDSGLSFDLTGWTSLSPNLAVSVNPSGTTVNSPNGLVTGLNVQTRYVAIEVDTVNGGTNPGLGEIQFFGTAIPEPSTLALLLSGFVGLQAFRSRFFS